MLPSIIGTIMSQKIILWYEKYLQDCDQEKITLQDVKNDNHYKHSVYTQNQQFYSFLPIVKQDKNYSIGQQ